MIRYIRFALFYYLAALIAVPIISCGPKEQATKPIIRPVRYQQVLLSGKSHVRRFSGLAKASLESRLSFRVPGMVKRVAVKVGDTVEVGQVIAELDPTDYQLQVQEAEASLAQAQAKARNAEANYERVRALYEDRNASKNDLDAARAESEYAKAAVKSGQKQLELTLLRVSYTRLKAPDKGAIAEVKVEENENVASGQVVVVLTAGSRPEVTVAMPENYITQIRQGNSVTVTFDAVSGESFEALVTEVGVAVTGLATTFPVTVQLKKADPHIRPGMAAEVAFYFSLSDGQSRLFVQPSAVGSDNKGLFVYIIEQTKPGFGIVRRHPVQIGELTADGLEIREGLNVGDLVVTAGVSRIEDGLLVKLLGTGEKESGP